MTNRQKYTKQTFSNAKRHVQIIMLNETFHTRNLHISCLLSIYISFSPIYISFRSIFHLVFTSMQVQVQKGDTRRVFFIQQPNVINSYAELLMSSEKRFRKSDL